MRVEGWERRLAEHVEAARSRAYQLGEHDCAIWAFDVVPLLTGRPLPVRLRGRYRNPAGALRTILRHGADMTAAVTAVLGVEPVPVVQARRGDMLLLPELQYDHLGLCLGAVGAVAGGADGLRVAPLLAFARCWRID